MHMAEWSMLIIGGISLLAIILFSVASAFEQRKSKKTTEEVREYAKELDKERDKSKEVWEVLMRSGQILKMETLPGNYVLAQRARQKEREKNERV